MNETIGVSGCFGGGNGYDHIDTAEETSVLVEEILQQDGQPATTTAAVGEDYLVTVQNITRLASEYARRIRILTYAVVAIVVYLVLKEASK